MALSSDAVSMALFCDFENIALGVRDAQYEKFDIKPVLERLLLKGSIVVKKAYCDWDRYKSFKAAMHEANFELIEIPHVRQSGKNSADIRMVVDALDLCYTKAHVDTFVIISGDSDFSPLVSKLRENAKRVIGVGVKQSTSDLLIANCDEFIYIDDLMRKRQRDGGGDRQNRSPADPQAQEAQRQKVIGMAVATLEALLEDRSDDEKVWASMLKEAIKRRHPGFNEAYFGYKSFGALIEDAARRGLIEVGRDNNSAYVKRRPPNAGPVPVETEAPPASMDSDKLDTPASSASPGTDKAVSPAPTLATAPPSDPVKSAASGKRRSRGGRKSKVPSTEGETTVAPVAGAAASTVAATEPAPATPPAPGQPPESPATTPAAAPLSTPTPAPTAVAAPTTEPTSGEKPAPARKPRSPRAPRRKKTDAAEL